jgi:hypothetical protein
MNTMLTKKKFQIFFDEMLLIKKTLRLWVKFLDM